MKNDRTYHKKNGTSIRSILKIAVASEIKKFHKHHCPTCDKCYAECSCELSYDELFPSEEDFQ